MEIITIKTKIDGQYPKVTSTVGQSYGVKDGSPFEIGKTYEVEYNERTVPKRNGGSFIAKDITSYKLSVPPTPVPTNNTVIKENMDFKQRGIHEVSALNNATNLVIAIAGAWANTSEIKETKLNAIVEKMEKLHLRELNFNRGLFGLPSVDVEIVGDAQEPTDVSPQYEAAKSDLPF